MSDMIIKCVFCGETTMQKTIKFTLKTLVKCLIILEYRRSKLVQRKSRTYDNLVLSIEPSLNEVYHAQCYKLFTAIKIPRDFECLQRQILYATADSTFTEAAGTSTGERKKNSTECEASEAPDTRQSGVATPLFRTCGAHYSPSELQNIMAEISTASILKISDEKTLQLIDLYYNEDCLWNTNSENYKNKERRSLAAEKIAAILDLPNFTAKHVMIKFKNLRDSYSQELKKITHSLALGDEHKYVPKVFWFSKMDSFIRPHLQGRFSKSASFTKNEPLADELEWTQLDDAELSPDHGGGEEFLIPITSRAKASDGECSEPKRRKLPARRTRDKRKNSETTIAETLKDIQSQLHVLTANNDDCHDTFGKYVASLLRALSPQRALALQPMIVSLITGAADEDPLSAVPDNLTQDVEIKLEITE